MGAKLARQGPNGKRKLGLLGQALVFLLLKRVETCPWQSCVRELTKFSAVILQTSSHAGWVAQGPSKVRKGPEGPGHGTMVPGRLRPSGVQPPSQPSAAACSFCGSAPQTC